MDDRPPADPSLRLSPSFMDGALLTAAAIPDAALVYAGSCCIQEHASHTFELADLGQDLLRDGRPPRLLTTFTDETLAPMGMAAEVRSHVERLLSRWRPGVVLLSELSRLTIAGDDLASVAASVEEDTGVPAVAATSPFLARDHASAFRVLLAGLADRIPDAAFEGGPVPGRVAVIGYLYERHEGDHRGSVDEVESMLRDLGLDPAPTWLSHAPTSGLHRAARASLLVALPHGRDAARHVAARSGAPVVEAALPLGLRGTEDFVRAVAVAAGREDRVDGVLGPRLAAALPLLDRVVGRRLAGRRVALSALSDWRDGLVRLLQEDLGLEVPVALLRGRFADDVDRMVRPESDPLRDHDPSVRTWNARVQAELDGAGLDLLAGSSWERNALAGPARALPFLEFGYPCFTWHALLPQPLLGIPGTLSWAQRIASLLAEAESR